jgi:hypothetical protein
MTAKSLLMAVTLGKSLALTAAPDGTFTNGAPFTFGPFANAVTVQGAAIYNATVGYNVA